MICFFAQRDALHDFAERAIARMHEVIGRAPLSAKDFGSFIGKILLRSGQWQIELLDMEPGVRIPTHMHPGGDGIEYAYDGEAVMTIGDMTIAAAHTSERRARWLKGKAVRVSGTTPHSMVVGAQGFRFVSIQNWHSTSPGHLGDNWAGAPSSKLHEKILRGLD